MLKKILSKIKRHKSVAGIKGIYNDFFRSSGYSGFGYLDRTSDVRSPIVIKGKENVYIYERTNIYGNARILATRARFIMKRGSGAAEGLTVVTGNHESRVGMWHRDVTDDLKDSSSDKDIIVEEDVWLGTNVTLLMGSHIGRGAVVGAGTVVRSNVPPYAIVIGNPAKVIGFKFTPDEIVKHEEALYAAEERIPREKLEKNYQKYYLNRIKEISKYVKL